MKSSRLAVIAAVVALLALAPLAAQAQQVALAAKTINLRAGPDRAYPVVDVFPGGVQLIVDGCLPDYTWCEVSYGPEHGWVYAGNLRMVYQQAYAPLVSVAPLVGIGILGFALEDYWGRYYPNRPWYPYRERWIHVTPHRVQPPPYRDHRERPDEPRFRPEPPHARPQPSHRPEPHPHPDARPPGQHPRPAAPPPQHAAPPAPGAFGVPMPPARPSPRPQDQQPSFSPLLPGPGATPPQHREAPQGRPPPQGREAPQRRDAPERREDRDRHDGPGQRTP